MSSSQWTAVDDYICDKLLPRDEALEAALEASNAAGMPAIQVTPNQGKLLYLLAQIQGAKSILEVGTLGGYSTIWLARAVPPGGRVVTLEIDPKHAAVARSNIERAGLSAVVEVRLGAAADTLRQLVAEKRSPFDFVFIDADKSGNADYFARALELTRVGSVIVVDNVVRNGAVIDASSTDISVQGVRRLNDLLSHHPRISTTAIQTVGSKGYDGFAIARVIA
jgi:predicted O-methyltransferase YrrM